MLYSIYNNERIDMPTDEYDDFDYSDEWREREQEERDMFEAERELDEC